MATLIKLQISGVRSFGPQDEHLQQISFDTPVTLIIGQNGCGKTTILEAIKYACTGDLPGGTQRGQGFVHHPKISEIAVTKGQIKLKLVDIKGDTYTIAKSVQLQQRANSMSFTSLDSALSILYSTGNKQQITGRCADIDKHCSQILQVSPCIINNVLFCHQENSSWPLDEGKKVKEKFDEIFDSKKYSKCSEVLTKLFKSKSSNIGTLKEQKKNLEDKKDEVKQKKVKLQETKSKCESLQENIRDKMESLDPHNIRLEEIEHLEVDIGKLQKELTLKSAERKGIVELQNMLKQSISSNFQGTDEELESEISSFEHKQRVKEKTISALEENCRQIEKKERSKDQEIQIIQITLGKLNEEKNQLDKKIKDQDSFFKKAKESLKMPENFIWNCEEDCQDAINELKLKLKDLDENLQALINSKNMEQSTIQGKIDQARDDVATMKQKCLQTKTEISNCERKTMQITNEIHDLDVGSSRLVDISRDLERLALHLENLQNNFSEVEAGKELEKTKREIAEIEEKVVSLESIYKVLQQNHIIDEKLNAEEQRRVAKNSESNKIKTKLAGKFQEMFAIAFPQDNFGSKIQSMLDFDEHELKRIRTIITSLQEKITKHKTQIDYQMKDIKRQEDDLNQKKSEINSVCQGKDFTTLLKETDEKKKKLQKEKGQYSSGKVIYEKFIEVFQEDKPCCPICETDFSSKQSIVKNIINKLQQKIKSIPEKLMNTERKLEEVENLYNKLQLLRKVNEEIEISDFKSSLAHEELGRYQDELNSFDGELTALNCLLKASTKKVDFNRSILPDAIILDQCNSEMRICEKNIAELKTRKIILETPQNLHEVENTIEDMKIDLAGKRKAYDTIRQKLDQHKHRCLKNNEEKSKLMEEQMKYQSQVNKKPQLEKQLEDLQDSRKNLLLEKEKQETEYIQLEKKLKSLNVEKQDLTSKNDKIINDERELNRRNQNLIDALVKINGEITYYRDEDLEARFDQAGNQLIQLEDEKKRFNKEKNETLKKITEQKEEIAKQVTELRNLKDNVILRDKQKIESSLVAEIESLEKKIGNYNYHTLYEEKKRLRSTIDKIEQDVHNLNGQEMQLKNTILDMEQELNLPSNKNAEKNYKEKTYELIVNEKVIDDIRIYTKALQNAILQFHKERMTQINERIRELWRNIYKGNDIDYIQINGEMCKETSTSKQAYDYKVVQIKNGIEIEMRGRCSAGQRVLACLIIRMALAESFSPHCGIMALDEPTTNLDRENVNSLAHALSSIITSHQYDNNFQLLVITHDQEFLNILRHSVQNISHYWRVSRDPQGYSIIKKERL